MMRTGAVRLSAALMTHPSRLQTVGRLRKMLPRLPVHLVVSDTGEPAAAAALRTAQRAWRSVPAGATHHLVVQDDVVLCADFERRLRSLVEARPDGCFALFAEWGTRTGQTARLAALAGMAWAPVADPWVPAQAVLLPAPVAAGFAEYLTAYLDDPRGGDGWRLYEYLKLTGRPPLVCVPSLAQHDTPHRPSLLPVIAVRGLRRAACYLDAPGSGPAGRSDVTRMDGLLPMPECLPFHSPHDLTARVCHRPGGAQRWLGMPTATWLSRRGFTASALAGLFSEALYDARLDPDNHLLGRELLMEVWLNAVATGHVLVDLTDPDRLSDGIPSAASREAVGTLVPGALRRVLSEPSLDRVRDDTYDLAASGVLAGAVTRLSISG